MKLVCLNCRCILTYPDTRMDSYKIIDGRKYFSFYFPFGWSRVLDKLMESYLSLQECYCENSHILKETEKSKKMIYRVMKKRCEENRIEI